MGPGQWLMRARAMNAARARFVTAIKNDLIEYEETLVAARLGDGCSTGLVNEEASGEGLEEGSDEELDVLLDKEKRRLDATSLHRELGDTGLNGDWYFDYCGILWMLQGKWGKDHPCEHPGDSFWDVPGAIYSFYEIF
ncbi:hypothetical protein PV325_011756 [Microctonus aethiopoides]|nr:hypothetical protein PV325_011756 [Microctonus aethiopoides]